MALPHIARAVLRLLALVTLLVIVMSCANVFVHQRVFDFNVFWDAGRQAWRGQALSVWIDRTLPHPPPFLLFAQPFALLSLPAALTLWVAATLALLVLVCRRQQDLSVTTILAFPPTLVNGIIGQTGFLIGAMYIGAAQLFSSRPFLAGSLLGAMVIKPQMGLLVPFALLAGREWRAFAGACCGALLLSLLAALAYGPDAFLAWYESLNAPTAVLMTGGSGWQKMASVFGTVSMLGFAANVAMAAHITIAIVALVAVIRTWSKNRDSMARFAVLACGTALASPYFYVYDLVFLIFPIAWCYRHSGKAWLTIGAAAALAPPAALNWFPSAFPNWAPLVSLLMLLLSWATSEAAVRTTKGVPEAGAITPQFISPKPL